MPFSVPHPLPGTPPPFPHRRHHNFQINAPRDEPTTSDQTRNDNARKNQKRDQKTRREISGALSGHGFPVCRSLGEGGSRAATAPKSTWLQPPRKAPALTREHHPNKSDAATSRTSVIALAFSVVGALSKASRRKKQRRRPRWNLRNQFTRYELSELEIEDALRP